MIKVFFILLLFILTGLIIWLLSRTLDPGHGQAIKDYTPSVCWNFNYTLSKEKYLPSDVISLSGSCDDANGTRAFCPLWNITSAVVDIKMLRDTTVQDGTGCIHMMENQVVNFKTTRKRVQLLVDFKYPKSQPVIEINIERSDDGEFCRQSRDCHFVDQFCSPSGSCTCADRWIFIRNVQKCVPAIYKVKGQCLVTEQCQFPNSNCHNNSCECNEYYIPDFDSTHCIPEGRDCGDSCLIDGNCRIKNEYSTCKMYRCDCSTSYPDSYDSRKDCCPKGAASSKAGFGWMILLLVVLTKHI